MAHTSIRASLSSSGACRMESAGTSPPGESDLLLLVCGGLGHGQGLPPPFRLFVCRLHLKRPLCDFSDTGFRVHWLSLCNNLDINGYRPDLWGFSDHHFYNVNQVLITVD